MPGPLAAKVRAKYPGVYDDLDDASLEKAILAKHPEYADLAQPEPQQAPSTMDMGLADQPGQSLPVRGMLALARGIKQHPVEAGAIGGSTLAAGATGGLSLLPQIAAAILGGGLGAGAGQAASGETPDLGTMASEGLMSGVGVGAGRAVGPVVRGSLRAVRAAPLKALDIAGYAVPQLRTLSTALRVLQRAAPEVAPASSNVGGRLVTGAAKPSVEEEMSRALDEVRAPSPARGVSLPPPAELPPGYQPRSTVPATPRAKTPPAAAPASPSADLPASAPPQSAPKATRAPGAAATGRAAPAHEGLSRSEREAVDAELSARGLNPTINAGDASRYLERYGQLIPPGTRTSRQGMHIQDALTDQRYRFHLDNPASALALGATGTATLFRDALLRALAGDQPQEP